MLFETIKKVHERPLPERRRLAFWVSLFLTLCIAVVWVLTLILSSSAPSETPDTAPPSPFENVWEGISEGFGSFKKHLPESSGE